MDYLFALLSLFVFLMGVLLGGFISFRALCKGKVKPEPIYVDDDDYPKKKRFSLFKKKDNADEGDSTLLEDRITYERSITEMMCEDNGTDIKEVVMEQQGKIDEDFEYLANNQSQ